MVVKDVTIKRECKYCGSKVDQTATVKLEGMETTVEVWLFRCPLCNHFLKKPTAEEITKALEEKKD